MVDSVKKLLEEDDKLRQELRTALEERKNHLVERIQKNAERHNGVLLLEVPVNVSAQMAKDIAFALKALLKEEEFVYIAACNDEGKPSLTLMLSDVLVARGYNASTLVREAGKKIQGGGGGQPSFATAGGKRAEGLPEAVAFIKNELQLN